MPQKPFVIGITGNIASGKSVVRNYLANFGADTIDADLTAKDSYLPGTPAWQTIQDTFGEDLCMADGQINRSKLGMIVLNDPASLRKLEAIVHPYVHLAISEQIEKCDRPVLAIEAIKLLESDVVKLCDQIWTAAADKQVRFERLVQNRGHSEELAWAKINAQAPQEEKIACSNTVIWTDGTFASTFQQTARSLCDLGLPMVRQIEQNSLRMHSIVESKFQSACDLLSGRTQQGWTCDRIYNVLAANLVPVLSHEEELIQVRRLSTRQNLALLTHQAPIKTEHASEQIIFPMLEDWLRGAYRLLAVSRMVLPSRDAWQCRFLPGEDIPEDIPEDIYVSFLKANGLMPGEVWVKSLI
ncbi:MAG: dephospho-CoA kinase [Anaerolineaceae bacterium]|nr:dephospho-CoA kinase [Anaerolineaceae bacterium]MDD4042849.1 dephospho-CoA kinase [Anaerolineaceae bacterium]